MTLDGWQAIGEGAWRVRWAGGEATLQVFPPIPGVSWPLNGFVEAVVIEAGGEELGALEPCLAGGLVGVTCRFALPGATDVDRQVCVLSDDRHLYAVRLDRRGTPPPGGLEDVWADALAMIAPPVTRVPASIPTGALEHWVA